MDAAATIGARLSALAAEAPLRPALVCDGETLTRARFAHRVAHLSREIAARTRSRRRSRHGERG